MVLAALIAAAIHLLPLGLAQRNTPDGYRFTGVLIPNPDMMQYQIWMREAGRSGIIVRNSLTTEANRPYLPVPFYWVIGKTARLTGVSPDLLYRFYGALFAALFAGATLLVVWRSFPTPHQRRWTYAVFLIGGTLTALIRLIVYQTPLHGMHFIKYTLMMGRGVIPGFEKSRSEFSVNLLFDPHYLLLWLLVMASIAACYRLLEQRTPARLLTALLIVPLTIFVHIHQIVLLTAIFASIAFLLYARGLLDRSRAVALLACWLPGLIVAAAVARIQSHSGLPFPEWRSGATPISYVMLGYPAALVALGWGLRGYWLRAGVRECVLLGWILGCALITLSGPFYPFPHRGLLTVQLPLTLVAASIYFAARPRLAPPVMAALVVLMIPMPLATLPNKLKATRFSAGRSYSWMTPAQDSVVARVSSLARPNDALLAPSGVRLWLAPDYPGVLYAGHGFLTVDYFTKEYRLRRFFADQDPARQAEFLASAGIRFVFVQPADNPARFSDIPGLTPLDATPAGTLFEFADMPMAGPVRQPYEPEDMPRAFDRDE